MDSPCPHVCQYSLHMNISTKQTHPTYEMRLLLCLEFKETVGLLMQLNRAIQKTKINKINYENLVGEYSQKFPFSIQSILSELL